MHVSDSAALPLLPRPNRPRHTSPPPASGADDAFLGASRTSPASGAIGPFPVTGGSVPTPLDSPVHALRTPDAAAPSAISLPPLQPGDRRTFWTWDFSVMPPAAKSVQATLRALGDRSQVWVDDTAWGQGVAETDVETLSRRLEQQAPPGAVNPTRGIVDINTSYFGPPPTAIDPDPRVTVLLTPFASFNGTRMDGYFNAFDQMRDSEAWEQYQQHSNERNIVYLNTAGAPVASDYMQGVLAHELSHLQQYGRAPEQAGWIGETLGEVAMAVNGYHTDYGHVARHQKKPGSPVESETYIDYGAACLFGTYMLERYGSGFITALAGESGNGREAISRTLQASGSADTFETLVADWVVANYADAQGAVSPGHHYASLDIPAPAETVVSRDSATAEATLAPTGAAYVRVSAPEGAQVRIEGGAAAVRALTFDGRRLRVDDLDARSEVHVPAGTVLAIAAVGTAPSRYTVTPAS